MQDADYPEFSEHQAKHQWLRQQVEERVERLKNDQPIDREALADLLKELLTGHIAVEDKQIGRYLRQRCFVQN